MFTFLLFRILISISSDSIIGVWIGLEINIVSIVATFSLTNKIKIEKTLILYFLIQRISSILMLISVLRFSIYRNLKNWFFILLIISIFIKIGIFPFHFWVIPIIEGLTWFNCLLLSTLQKIVPLILLFIIIPPKITIRFLIINRVIASIRGLNQFSLRKIIGFSSINHLRFLTITVFISKKIFKIYFLTYLFITILAFKTFSNLNLNYLYQTLTILKNNKIVYLIIIFSVLRLAGTPPFLGFFPKIIVILNLLELKFFIPSILILISNVIATFFYLRITTRRLFINLRTLKTKKKYRNPRNLFPYLLMIFPFIFILWNLKLKKLSIFKIEIKRI